MKSSLFFIFIFCTLQACESSLTKEDAKSKIRANGIYPIKRASIVQKNDPFDKLIAQGLIKDVTGEANPKENYSSGFIPKVYVSIGPIYEPTEEGKKYIVDRYKGEPMYLFGYLVVDEILEISKNKETGNLDVTYTERDSAVTPFGEILSTKELQNQKTPRKCSFYKSDVGWELSKFNN